MGSAETVHHPKALMGQGVHRTQTENHPIRPVETAEGLKWLLDWHSLIRFGEETKHWDLWKLMEIPYFLLN